jgi:hypothetical protein
MTDISAVQALASAALPSCTYNNGTAGVGATLTASSNGALTIDGYTVLLGDRVAVSQQSAQLQNGIYSLTTLGDGSHQWILTRTTDFNTPAAINAQLPFCVLNGNQNINSVWCSSAVITTIGTDSIQFANMNQSFQRNGSGAQIGYAAGNVGVGNSNPSYPLDVSGTSRFYGTALMQGPLVTNNIAPPSDSTTAIQIFKTDQGTTVVDIDTTNSRVGIGTTSPSNILSLGGGAAQTFWMERNTTSNTAGNGLTVQASGATSGATNKNGGNLTLSSGISTGSGTSNINFNVFPGTAGSTTDNTATTAMTITGAGYVGIGTTAPLRALNVVGSFGLGSSLTNAGVAMQTNSGVGQIFGINIDNNTWNPLEFSTGGGTPSVYLDTSGHVGIGTTSPSYTMHVNGSVAGTSAYVNLSDIRHKKNIEPLLAGLKTVEQLKPVTFEWKNPKADGGMQGKQIGFIAQDVEKVLPSVVLTEDNADKTKSMKYAEIIPILVKAIQEQQQEIRAMKAKLGM